MKKTEDIWNQFGEHLRSFILKRVKDENTTKDILQEVFITVHAKIDSLKDEDKVKAWVFQITRNTIIDYFRSINKRFNPKDLDFSNEEDNTKNFEIVTDLMHMMEELPDDDCEALCLTEFEGFNQKQYAEKKGISYSAAKSRIQRARIKLKDELLKCCHFQFDKYGTILDYHPISCCCCEQHQDKEQKSE